MSTLTTQNTPLDPVNLLTPDIIAQIHAEIHKIKRYDKHKNLIMTMDAIGLTGDIRYAVVDGVPGLSLLDIVIVGAEIMRKESMVYAKMTRKEALDWLDYHMPEISEKAEVSEKFRILQFKGPGQRSTKIATVDQAITVLEMLPGDNGKKISNHIRKLGRRVISGDQRMHEVIDANAQNNSDVHVMARVATVIDAVEEGEPIPILAVTRGDLGVLERSVLDQIKSSVTDLENRLVKRSPTITDVNELENRLVQRCPTIAAMNQMKEEILNSFIRSERSKRARDLYDRKANQNHELAMMDKQSEVHKHKLIVVEKEIEARKHQLELLEKETEAAIKKQKSSVEAEKLKQTNDLEMHIKREEAALKLEEKKHKLEMKKKTDKAVLEERRLPIAKHYEDLKDREQQRVNVQLQQQQLHVASTGPVIVSTPITYPTGFLIFYNVGTHYKMFGGIKTNELISILNKAKTIAMNKLHGIGETTCPITGMKTPKFQKHDIPEMQNIIKESIKDVMTPPHLLVNSGSFIG